MFFVKIAASLRKIKLFDSHFFKNSKTNVEHLLQSTCRWLFSIMIK